MRLSITSWISSFQRLPFVDLYSIMALYFRKKIMEKINRSTKKQTTIVRLILAAVLLFSVCTFFGITSQKALAATPTDCPNGQVYRYSVSKCVTNTFGCVPGQAYDEVDGCVGGSNAQTVTCPDGTTTVLKGSESQCPAVTGKVCGGGTDSTGKANSTVTTSIDLGCRGKGNPILDLTFAVIRFLSTGVGIVLVGSMIWAGIQYTASRGDPGATAKAIGRIRSNVVALLIFIFAYAILNYIIPGQLLK